MASDVLTVKYTLRERINPVLDEELIKLLGRLGFVCWASGGNHETGERDLAFARTSPINPDVGGIPLTPEGSLQVEEDTVGSG